MASNPGDDTATPAASPTDDDATAIEEPTLSKPPATSVLSRIWDNALYFVVATLFGLSVLPLVGFLLIGIWEGNLWLPGEQTGFLEAPSFLSIFLIMFLTPLAVRHALEKQYDVLGVFTDHLLRYDGDEDSVYLDGREAAFSSTLTEREFQELLDFYGFLLAKATFRGGSDAVYCPSPYEGIYRRFTHVFLLLSLGGGIVLGVTTYYHWFAESIYGFDIWASSTYPLAFVARFVYEAVLLLVVGPLVIIQLILLCFLNYHPFQFLTRRNGLRFRRFALDGVGGLGVFGNQAFRNVAILAPLSLQLVTYALFLPTTPLLLVGLSLYVLAIPTLFVIQLLGAHRAMKRARQVELELIGKAYAENYENYKRILMNTESVAEMDDERLVVHHEAMEKADAIYDEIQTRPTWPFRRTVLGKVASLTLSLITGFVIVLVEGMLV